MSFKDCLLHLHRIKMIFPTNPEKITASMIISMKYDEKFKDDVQQNCFSLQECKSAEEEELEVLDTKKVWDISHSYIYTTINLPLLILQKTYRHSYYNKFTARVCGFFHSILVSYICLKLCKWKHKRITLRYIKIAGLAWSRKSSYAKSTGSNPGIRVCRWRKTGLCRHQRG